MQIGQRVRNVGTLAFTWGDLWDFCHYAPSSSNLAYELHGTAVVWTVTDHLLAAAVDALNAANWQRGGGKGSRPKPITRPGTQTENKIGRDPVPIKDFDSWWDGE